VEREGSIEYRKEGIRVPSLNSFFGLYSMNKTGGRRKMFINRQKWQVDLAAAQHPLSPFLGLKFEILL
jgi:hypothetical protein